MAGRPTNVSELTDYIKRKLGSPYYKTQLTQEQISDTVFDALNFYAQYVYDGTQRGVYVLHTVDAQNEYTLPSDIYAVTNILPRSSFQSYYLRFPSNQATLQEISFIFGALTGPIDQGLSTMLLGLMNMDMFERIFVPKEDWNFNMTTGKLHLFQTPGIISPSDTLALMVERFIDRDGTGTNGIYSNIWFLKYVVVLAKLQLYNNISKFGGTLPGGLTLNQELYKVDAEKEALERQAIDKLGDMASLYSINWG